jgi:glycosyltransferase involved in cell wall biosynthesis
MDMRDAPVRQPMRLLFLTDSPIAVSGGSERFLRNLVNGLAPARFETSVIQLCEEPPAAARVHEASVAPGINLEYLPCGAVYGRSGMRAYGALRRRVLQEGFHVIQSQHENADFINALLPRGRSDAIRISNRRDTGFLKSARLRLASRVLNHRYDRIIAPSTAILDAVAVAEHAPRERMRCIPNGVDATRFRPADASQPGHLRAELGLAQDALLVGCVADLFAVKRHTDLVDAFALVRESCPQAQLLLVGEGPLRDAIESRVRARRIEDGVHMLGSRRDVDRLLPALDAFVLASDTEGLSNAILEAQACGLPVVATHVGGNPDLVDHACGTLVPARDSDAMAEAIITLLRDPDLRKRMGAAARSRVVSNHSLESMTQAYVSLYHELVHAR